MHRPNSKPNIYPSSENAAWSNVFVREMAISDARIKGDMEQADIETARAEVLRYDALTRREMPYE